MTTEHPRATQLRTNRSEARKLSRRSLLAGTFLSIFFVGNGVKRTAAYRGWCRVDPQFLIAGNLALVTISAQVSSMTIARDLSTGPINLILTVPSGTDARYLASNNGFGDGYDVSIEYSDELQSARDEVPVTVEVLVPMKGSAIPVLVAFIPAGSAVQSQANEKTGTIANTGSANGVLTAGFVKGMANDWIALTT